MAYLRTFFFEIKLEIKFKISLNFISFPCFGPFGNKVWQHLSTLFPVHVYIHNFEFLLLIPLKIWRVCLYPDLISQMWSLSLAVPWPRQSINPNTLAFAISKRSCIKRRVTFLAASVTNTSTAVFSICRLIAWINTVALWGNHKESELFVILWQKLSYKWQTTKQNISLKRRGSPPKIQSDNCT